MDVYDDEDDGDDSKHYNYVDTDRPLGRDGGRQLDGSSHLAQLVQFPTLVLVNLETSNTKTPFVPHTISVLITRQIVRACLHPFYSTIVIIITLLCFYMQA